MTNKTIKICASVFSLVVILSYLIAAISFFKQGFYFHGAFGIIVPLIFLSVGIFVVKTLKKFSNYR